MVDVISSGYMLGILTFVVIFIAPSQLKFSFLINGPGKVQYGVNCQFGWGLIGVIFQEVCGCKKWRICILRVPINIGFLVQWFSKDRKEKKKKKFKKNKLWIRFFWRERGRIFVYLKRLQKFFILDYWKGEIKFGFSDPATTGEVYGALCIVNAQKRRKLNLAIKPEFIEPCFLGDFSGRVVFFPLILLFVLVLGALDFSWRYKKICPWLLTRSVV